MLTAVSVSHAEIRWVLKVLISHLSYRSCLNLNSLFATMFPDSLIAKSFKLSKTKCTYYVVYGLAPHLKELLVQNIKLTPYYSILFDESLNHHLQDACTLHVRFMYVSGTMNQGFLRDQMQRNTQGIA